jgi:streptogramin lyase
MLLWPLLIAPGFAATLDLGNGFADHGVATPSSMPRGTVATVDGRQHPVVLSWLMDQRGCYELLLIDVLAGKAEEFPLPFPLGDSPFASILSSRNKFYTHFGGYFVEFDPVERAFTFCHKTAPQMAMSLTEDDQGVIWSATYPHSGVVSFNPKNRQLRDYGYVYKQDWPMYPRSVAVDDTGWVYIGLGFTASQILAMDAKTGHASPLMAEPDRGKGAAQVYRAVDGKVYGQPLTSQHEKWLLLYQGHAGALDGQPAAEKPIIAASQSLFHDRFPDGKRLKMLDLIEQIAMVEDPKTKQKKTLHFDYGGEGADIMGLAAAPDGTICGGTTFPMRFFRYDPKRDRWTRHPALGQWNTVARQGDRFFAGTYGGGGLLEWNPFAGWVDTERGKKLSNPAFLTESAPTINRPHKLLAHPDGRTLVLAGTPGYGYTGGGLLFWDRPTATRVLLTHEQLIPQQSTMSLVALPGGRLLGGTTISPGTGGQYKAKQAELYLLDLATKRILWHEVAIPGVDNYFDLCLGPDGLVWGFADSTQFFVFDPATKKIVHRESTDKNWGPASYGQGPRIFVHGPKGKVYVLFQRAIARIEPKDWKFTLLAKSPVRIATGGDYLDGRIYFATASHLHSFKLPD